MSIVKDVFYFNNQVINKYQIISNNIKKHYRYVIILSYRLLRIGLFKMLIDKNYLESLTIDSLTKLENLIKREKKIRKGVFKDKITSIILNKLLNNSLMSTNLLK